MLMNKTKSLYEAPTTDVLVVRFEGVVCSSPLQTLGLIAGGLSSDQGFGDSAADVQDLSNEEWW